MLKITVTLLQLLKRMLPYHMRQPNRLDLFGWPVQQLHNLYTHYLAWRANIVYEANTTGQTFSLQTFLNKTVTGAVVAGTPRIYITDYDTNGLLLSLAAEQGNYADMGLLLPEPLQYTEVPTFGEVRTLLSVNFNIFAPPTANTKQIIEITNRYKLAGKSYNIITN